MQSSNISQQILFVGEDTNIHRGLGRLFKQKQVTWGYHFASGVDEALGIMKDVAIDAVISDIKMPSRDGFDLLSHLRSSSKWQDLPIVMLTGLENPSLKSKALDLGATDLLNKPINPDELMARLRSVLYIKDCQDKIKNQNGHLEKVVRERTEALEATRLDVIWRLGKAAEYRSDETGNHIVRVGCYSKILADQLGLSGEEQEMIFLTSPLHDLGQIGIPDRILTKEGRLNAKEWEVMKTHCTIGQELLLTQNLPPRNHPGLAIAERTGLQKAIDLIDNPMMQMAAEIAGFHHEQWQGNGYPFAVKGEDIPLVARIVAISDVYDTLRNERAYKAALSHEETLVLMRKENGIRFDPAVFDAFEQSLTGFIEIQNQYDDI